VKIIHDKIKVHSLTGRITDDLMLKAFKAVKKNRGAAGIDKVTISMYEKNLPENLSSLMRELKQGLYQPVPLRRVHIPKGEGKTRALGIPTVKCRVAQEVIRRLINSIFESRFHDNSFGFRKGRNCHQAVERLLQYAGHGYRYVVDVDIKGFFDNIPLDLIMDSVAARIADGNILNLIEKFLNSGVMEEGKITPTIKGTPQGGVISPLLANIILDHLDWFLETKISHFSEGFDVLGFSIKNNSIKMRTKSIEKLKNSIRNITTRSHNLDKEVIKRLNRVIRGTVNYFSPKFSTMKTTFYKLDRWIRKRIRCMKHKRIWQTDNWRCTIKHIEKMGLINCRNLHIARLNC
jgi:RNA-directed DNA polymerase